MRTSKFSAILLGGSKRPAGIYRHPSAFNTGIPIPVGIKYVQLRVDVTNLTKPEYIVDILAEMSFDSGETFARQERVRLQGGPIKMTDMGGNPIVRNPPYISTFEFHCPEPQNQNRRVRVTVELAGSPPVEVPINLDAFETVT